MKRVVSVLAIFVGAVSLLLGAARPLPVGAIQGPHDVLLINPDICIAIYTGDLNCNRLANPTYLTLIGDCDPSICPTQRGNNDGILEPADFNAINLSKGMAHDYDGGFSVLVFVNDHAPVKFYAPIGVFPASGRKDLICGTVTDVIAGNADVADEDCGAGGTGDGVVVADWYAGGTGIARGPSSIRVVQKGVSVSTPFTVVGEPHTLEFMTLEKSVQTGIKDLNGNGNLKDEGECPLAGDVKGFLDALAKPEKTVLITRVLDSDGNQITGGFMKFAVDDPKVAQLASDVSVSLDLGGFGVGAPNILCGTKIPGTIKVTAQTTGEVFGSVLDPRAQDDHKSIEFAVLGTPAAATLTATPASLTCDGNASVEVAAAVVDAAGNPVADGNAVQFDIKVLGTANPVVGKTAGGIAKSTITPLSAAGRGVPVVVTVGDAQTSVLVQCAAAASGAGSPAGAPGGGAQGAGAGGPTGIISGPDTGLGGVGADGSGALSWWPMLALATAALALAAARLTFKRR